MEIRKLKEEAKRASKKANGDTEDGDGDGDGDVDGGGGDPSPAAIVGQDGAAAGKPGKLHWKHRLSGRGGKRGGRDRGRGRGKGRVGKSRGGMKRGTSGYRESAVRAALRAYAEELTDLGTRAEITGFSPDERTFSSIPRALLSTVGQGRQFPFSLLPTARDGPGGKQGAGGGSGEDQTVLRAGAQREGLGQGKRPTTRASNGPSVPVGVGVPSGVSGAECLFPAAKRQRSVGVE